MEVVTFIVSPQLSNPRTERQHCRGRNRSYHLSCLVLDRLLDLNRLAALDGTVAISADTRSRASGTSALLEGIVGAISPWTLAWPLLAPFALVATRTAIKNGLALHGLRRMRHALARLTGSPGSAATSLCVAILAVWEALWASAPEIQAEALSMKAWLPAVWAQSGRISISTYFGHPQSGSHGNR